MKLSVYISLFLFIAINSEISLAQNPSTKVKQAIDYYRDTASYMEGEMLIHRASWERKMSLQSWTKGSDQSLVRFISPPQEAGNGSLMTGGATWTYSKKINKVVKIPSSMVSQSWMGSDFSYNDLSKADDIVKYYTHTSLGFKTIDGERVEVIESIPKDEAPSVWGKEVLYIQDDLIIKLWEYFDQDMKLVKKMEAFEIGMLGEKKYAKRLRMSKQDKVEEWTEVLHTKVLFGINTPESTFTISNLQNPRN